MADTVSSNFTRKLKDKKISDMQTVENQESVQLGKMKNGVAVYGG